MALTAKKVYAILKRQISDMEAKLNSPVRYRGTVATADLLPLNPDIGDMYNIESKSVYGEAGMNVAWNGVVWDTMGAPIDMSLYIKSNELADWVKQQNKPAYTAEEVGALPADTKIPSKTSELKNDSGFLTKVPDGYLNGTDATLKESGKAADAKTTGDKFTEMSADISKKLDKNQGSENSGKIAGINEAGDIVPMFPIGVEYNSETNCLEFGSDQKMELNQGIGLDSSLTKTGYAADAGVVGEVTNSLKEDLSTKITKFYASSQGETHLADSDDGKIMDMMLYGKSEQKQYTGKNLLSSTLGTVTINGITCTANSDGTYTLNGTASANAVFNLGSVTFTGDTKYKICGCPQGGGVAERYHIEPHESTNEQRDIGNGVIYSLPNDESKIIYIVVFNGFTANNLLFKPMITTDLTATYNDFEPYTGGQPSPSPDYPQEIKSVVNPTVKVCRKNLFDSKKFPLILNRAINGNTGNIYVSSSGRYCTTEKYIPFPYGGKKVSFNASMSLYAYDKDYKFISAIRNSQAPLGTIYIRFDIRVEDKDKVQIELSENTTTYEPYHEQTVTLPYTLNAIPVSSGGNVTIDGQQYVSDYVDVERGKLVQRIWRGDFDGNANERWAVSDKYEHFNISIDKLGSNYSYTEKSVYCNRYQYNTNVYSDTKRENGIVRHGKILYFRDSNITNLSESGVRLYLAEHPLIIITYLDKPIEIDLTPEEITAFKALATYYPVTNIRVNSEQLDGYTVFNYPISMENGWNYVKKQLNDNRDYIYDMDARTQDTDLQAAEAYVNSEYAVALTELEV